VALRSYLACVLSLAAVGLTKTAVDTPSGTDSPSFLYTAAPAYESQAWMHGAERFASGAAIFVRDGNTPRRLAPGFGASADPSVSFDGQRVLFAGKVKASDPWQIWEIALAGGEPRRVTSGAEDWRAFCD
jgi:Tol biopolymer transport system component